MCRLEDSEGAADSPFVVSITHLKFDARTPMYREIAAYQKRRIKWLRKSGAAKLPLQEDGLSGT
ncbi:MAG TPA: hypothetical protein VFE34_07160 [Dongiaceae bacterium]|jgi:hypothetical protein|nr:hypothetical protein [Dongiaceae bacterium]